MTKEEIEAEGQRVQEAIANLLMPIVGSDKCRGIMVFCLWEHEPKRTGQIMAVNFSDKEAVQLMQRFVTEKIEAGINPSNARTFRAEKPVKN